MKIIGSFAGLTLDIKGAKAALNKELAEILIAGTKAWVRSMTSNVPTWSGMSQAALKPIADLVDMPVFSTPVNGAPDRRAQGEQLGTASLNTAGPRFYFRWHTAVHHFIFNEYNNANNYGFRLRNPGPYYSQKRASLAFFNVVRPRLRKLKFDIQNHIKVTRKVIR